MSDNMTVGQKIAHKVSVENNYGFEDDWPELAQLIDDAFSDITNENDKLKKENARYKKMGLGLFNSNKDSDNG